MYWAYSSVDKKDGNGHDIKTYQHTFNLCSLLHTPLDVFVVLQHEDSGIVGRIMVCYRSHLQRAVLIMESGGLEGGDIS